MNIISIVCVRNRQRSFVDDRLFDYNSRYTTTTISIVFIAFFVKRFRFDIDIDEFSFSLFSFFNNQQIDIDDKSRIFFRAFFVRVFFVCVFLCEIFQSYCIINFFVDSNFRCFSFLCCILFHFSFNFFNTLFVFFNNLFFFVIRTNYRKNDFKHFFLRV